MLGGDQGVDDAIDAVTSDQRSLRRRSSMVCAQRSREMKLAVEILLR